MLDVETPLLNPLGTITSDRRNPVSPRANRLMTTPDDDLVDLVADRQHGVQRREQAAGADAR